MLEKLRLSPVKRGTGQGGLERCGIRAVVLCNPQQVCYQHVHPPWACMACPPSQDIANRGKWGKYP